MKIEEGMHAITKDRLYISKIIRMEKDRIYAKFEEDGSEYILDPKKYNFYENIIDLVEGGDYVNGYKVTRVITYSSDNPEVNRKILIEIEQLIYDKEALDVLKNYEIQDIVTKEQFEACKYKVEG